MSVIIETRGEVYAININLQKLKKIVNKNTFIKSHLSWINPFKPQCIQVLLQINGQFHFVSKENNEFSAQQSTNGTFHQSMTVLFMPF